MKNNRIMALFFAVSCLGSTTNRIYSTFINDEFDAWLYQRVYDDEALPTAAGDGEYGIVQKMMADAHIAVANNGVNSLYQQLSLESKYQVDEALLEAAAGRHRDIVKLFVQLGADVNVRGADNDTPIKLATKAEHKGVVEYLLQYVDDESKKAALLEAAYTGSDEIVDLLLSDGVNVDTCDNQKGNTPLMNASYAGELSVVRGLLMHNAEQTFGNNAVQVLEQLTSYYFLKHYNQHLLIAA